MAMSHLCEAGERGCLPPPSPMVQKRASPQEEDFRMLGAQSDHLPHSLSILQISLSSYTLK